MSFLAKRHGRERAMGLVAKRRGRECAMGLLVLLASTLAGLFGGRAAAQVGGPYDLTWNSFDGGGGASSGGSIDLRGTAGQPDAGLQTGGSFSLAGGFWAGGADTQASSVDGGAGPRDGPFPRVFQLHPIAPNPFRLATTLSFDLPEARAVRLAIYNVQGALVRDLVDEPLGPGRYHQVWDGRDRRGLPVAGGVYWLRLEAGADRVQRRLLLLK